MLQLSGQPNKVICSHAIYLCYWWERGRVAKDDVEGLIGGPALELLHRTLSLPVLWISCDYRIISCSRSVGVPRASLEAVDDRIAKKEEQAVEKCRVLRISIVCGGPLAENGISLNSTRSVLDNICWILNLA